MPSKQDIKVRARRLAHLARRSGELVRPHTCQCKDCPMHPGQPCKRGDFTGDKLEMHHADHSKPLDVTFLCNVCHKFADERTQMTIAVIEQARTLRAQGLSLAYVAKRLGVSIRTLRKHVSGAAISRIACANGHPWIPENIYTRPDGGHECLICRRARATIANGLRE